MTNKQLQQHLQEFPDDMEVLMFVDGCRWIEPSKPMKKFMGTSQKDCIIISRKIT